VSSLCLPVLIERIASSAGGDRIKELRDRLGLSDYQAAEILRALASRYGDSRCPHCGQPLAPLPDSS
jgi:hypothetical protein